MSIYIEFDIVGCVKTFPLIDCCSPLTSGSLSDREAEELERLFRTLGDRHRIKILNLLAETDDAACVCQLVPALGLAQPTVSYHLKQLVDAGLLERERRSTFAYYRIVPGALDRVSSLLTGPADGEPSRLDAIRRPGPGSRPRLPARA